MDFDKLMTLASKNQQQKAGVKNALVISTALPAPKKIEKKPVDAAAIQKLIEDKKTEGAVDKRQQEVRKKKNCTISSSQPSKASVVFPKNGVAIKSSKDASAVQRKEATVKESNNVDDMKPRPITNSAPMPSNGSCMPSSASRMASNESRLKSNRPEARSHESSGSKLSKNTSKAKPPAAPLKFSDLIALATARKAAVDNGSGERVPTVGERAATSRAPMEGERVSSGPLPANHAAKCAADLVTDPKGKLPQAAMLQSDASHSHRRRKRSSKMPSELEDLLGIQNLGTNRIMPAHSSLHSGPPSSVKLAPSDSSKRSKSAQSIAAKASKSAPQAAQDTVKKVPAMSKALLAIAVTQKKAAVAAAAASKLKSETVASAALERRPKEGACSSTARSTAAMAAGLKKVGTGKVDQSGRGGDIKAPKSSLSNWDQIVGKMAANKKPYESRKRLVVDSDEDEYDEEMDDFIDDGPDGEGGANVSSVIQQIFGYDRRRYRDEEEDDINMESRFADVMKEEARSARLGKMEDLEDMRKEEEYKKAKKRKS